MLRALKNQKGFTFIESILTTLVLSIGLWGTMALFQNATSNVSTSNWQVIATQLANEKLENIIADKKFQGYNTIDSTNYPNETLSAPYQGLQRNVTITEVSPADFSTPEPYSGYKLITVEVVWSQEVGSLGSVNVSTLLTNYT
ncbi:MAG TPA: hypothetical protein DDW49_11305 [Deltaproteobacteria bacterium]|nr:hypothetical protein [Deltaproteobacteria bacterium]